MRIKAGRNPPCKIQIKEKKIYVDRRAKKGI